MSQSNPTTLGRLDRILGLLFQCECLLCRKDHCGTAICANCLEGLPDSPPSFIGLNGIRECFSLLPLTEELRAILHRIKYRRHPALLGCFHRRMTALNLPAEIFGATVIPIPMHWKKRIDRGFNQAEHLSRWFSLLPVDRESLQKTQATTPQVFLSKNLRSKNQKARFAWHSKKPAPQKVLLVDDVLTTGATLEECARVLRNAGSESIYAWTLFRTLTKPRSA